jgi:DNA-binding protein HU-beta
MNQTELLAAIAKESKLTKIDTEKFFNSMVSIIGKTLKKDSKIFVPGFIGFTKVKRAAYTGRNPQTGKEIKIAAKNVIKIKAGKTLADAVA